MFRCVCAGKRDRNTEEERDFVQCVVDQCGSGFKACDLKIFFLVHMKKLQDNSVCVCVCVCVSVCEVTWVISVGDAAAAKCVHHD